MEEIKEELLQSIVKDRSEDLELINKSDKVLTLQDALEFAKQYKKYLHNEKRQLLQKGQILHQFKESENLLKIYLKD